MAESKIVIDIANMEMVKYLAEVAVCASDLLLKVDQSTDEACALKEKIRALMGYMKEHEIKIEPPNLETPPGRN